jgi:hypothetical protein
MHTTSICEGNYDFQKMLNLCKSPILSNINEFLEIG